MQSPVTPTGRVELRQRILSSFWSDHIEPVPVPVHYRLGLQLAPENVTLLNNLGLSLALSGDFPASIDLLLRVVASAAATARHRQNLALIYGLANRTDDARAVARLDLDELSVERNLAYYAMLQRIEDSRRRAAAIGDSSGARLDP